MKKKQVVILGGGLAGLSAARYLHEHHIEYVLLEKNSHVGGRLRTSTLNGIPCDHGFQILLTAYPEVQQQLHVASLDPFVFPKCSRYFTGSGWHTIGHPFSSLKHLYSCATNPDISIKDLPAAVSLLKDSLRSKETNKKRYQNTSTATYIQRLNLSSTFKDAFLTPFFRSVFLEETLQTPVYLFLYYLKCFVFGDAILPKKGIQAIPEQLASHLPTETLRCNEPVLSLSNNMIITSHNQYDADIICCALDNPACHDLFGVPKQAHAAVTNAYFELAEPLCHSSAIHVNGYKGPIRNFHQRFFNQKPVLSLSAFTHPFSPLTSATLLQEAALFFGPIATTFKPITLLHINHALPLQRVQSQARPTAPPRVIFCGDWVNESSINGALESGKQAAKQIHRFLTGRSSSL